jgi:hypothetical protein
MSTGASHDRDFVLKIVRETLAAVRGRVLTTNLAYMLAWAISRKFPITREEVTNLLSNPLYFGKTITDDIVEDRARNISELVMHNIRFPEVA